MPDFYTILTEGGSGEFRDKGSKFIGFAHPVQSAAAALEWVAQHKKEHLKARHWCYAYRLGSDQNNFRTNDDGEPSSTAGKPILGQIDKLGLSDTLVVVVRYFGGVKLGTSGLIHAYRTAAALALEGATLGQRPLINRLRLHFTYELMGKVLQALAALQLQMEAALFEAAPQLDIVVPRSQTTATQQQLLAQIGGVYLEEVTTDFEVPGLRIEWLAV